MDQEYTSRSQKKRDSTALQKAGEELAALSPSELEQFDLSPDLLEALAFWRTLKNHEARRRHMQYIGRLMREEDDQEAVLASLEALRQGRRGRDENFHLLERLRADLLAPDEAARAAGLAGVLEAYPHLEPGKLRHLIESALAEKEKGRPPKSARQLFRYLKEALLP